MPIQILFFLSVVTACSDSGLESKSRKYFSLSEFFKQEEQQLSQTHFSLIKTRQYGSKSDSSVITHPDWQKELSLFEAADINKPAWKNSFRTDSLKRDNLLQVNYTAINSACPIKLVELFIIKQNVEKVYILRQTDNFVYSTKQELWYQKNKVFKINGNQKVLWFFDNNYTISAKIKTAS